MSIARRFLLLNTFVVVFLVSCVHGDNVITGEMYEQWGNEIIKQIDSDFGRSDGLYNHTVTDGWADFAWGQGIMFGANVAAARVDSARLTQAEKQAQEMYNSYRCYHNGYWAFNASRYNCGDRYYDDNAWIALAYLELYEITGKTIYLNWAREILIFCMSGENDPGDSPDGGIRWHENDTGGASVCSTAPTILANLMVYQLTGVQSYLDDATRLYEWMVDSDLRYSHWIYHETNQGPLGYQTSVMTSAAIRLYAITGTTEYLDHAYKMSYSMQDTFINSLTHSLGQHGKWGGHDMTNSYVDMYFLDGNTYWLDVATGYLEYLYLNCLDPESGLYPDVWDITSGDYSEYVIDNASVARSYWTMALTVGGRTENDTFVDKMIGHWTFDETTGTIAADSSGFTNDGTLSGASFTFDNSAISGKLNGALNFDGNNDFIDLPDVFANFKDGFSVSVWAYPTAVKNWARFIDFGNGEYDNNIVLTRRGSSNDLAFEAYDRAGSGGQVVASGAIELNRWQLFTVTMDLSGNVWIYKNGVEIASGQTVVPTNIEREFSYVGRSNWSSDAYYQGRMDDLRIFNYPLSAQDALELYHNGGQAENPLPANNSIDIVESQELSWAAGVQVSSYDIYLGTDYDTVASATMNSAEYKGRQSVTNFVPSGLSSATTYYWRIDQVYAAGISIGHTWSFTTAALPTDELLVHYTMDSEHVSGQTVVDVSGNPILSGTLVGPAVIPFGPMPDILRFDDSDDYVELPDGFSDLTDGFSVSFWVYPTEVGNWARFIDFGNGPSADNIVFARYADTNDLSFGIYKGSNDIGKIRATGVIEQNTWQMLTATINPVGYVKLYKDGVRVAYGRLEVPNVVTRTTNYIGKSNWSNPYYKGGMDDFGIWNRTLSPAEIASMYERGLSGISLAESPDPMSPVAYWQFNEGSGTDLLDSSSNGNNAVLYNTSSASWSSGKHCTGLTYDGSDDFLVAHGFNGIVGGGSRTCCAWIKTTSSSFMIVNWGALGQGNRWSVQLSPGGVLAVGIDGGYILGSTDLRDNLWHHVAVVLENDGTPNINELDLYVDGQPESTGASSGFSVNTGSLANVKSGVDILGNDFVNGSVDEIMIFSRALDASEISQVYNEYALSADFIQDGTIDMSDFSILANYWQDIDTCDIDLNCDCVVNVDDLVIFADQWLAQ